jgi:hypothetical protein
MRARHVTTYKVYSDDGAKLSKLHVRATACKNVIDSQFSQSPSVYLSYVIVVPLIGKNEGFSFVR